MSNLKLVCLGFQCRTCGYKFHHRCSNQVPALCQQVFYLVVFFYDITWLQGASHPSLFICEFLKFSTLLNRKQRFLVQSIFLKGIIFKIGYNWYHYILIIIIFWLSLYSDYHYILIIIIFWSVTKMFLAALYLD